LPAFKGLDASYVRVDFRHYTHVDLAFANPSPDGRFFRGDTLTCALDGESRMVSRPGVRRLARKVHRAGAKLLVSIGGGVIPQCSGDWAALLVPDKRAALVRDLVALVDSFGLDGIDVDLEGELMTRIDRAGNFTPFVAELAAAMRARGKLLTCATASYEGGMVPESSLPYFDLVGVMSYDAIGPTWGEAGSEHATLAQAERDLAFWIGKGVPPAKLALGLPFYGYGFGRYRRNYALNELAREFGPGAVGKDVQGQLCAGCDYVTYNGLVTLRAKARLAGRAGAGAMVWEISQDLPDGEAIRAVRAGLQKGLADGKR
jgi:GH18 family chitinase